MDSVHCLSNSRVISKGFFDKKKKKRPQTMFKLTSVSLRLIYICELILKVLDVVEALSMEDGCPAYIKDVVIEDRYSVKVYI